MSSLSPFKNKQRLDRKRQRSSSLDVSSNRSLSRAASLAAVPAKSNQQSKLVVSRFKETKKKSSTNSEQMQNSEDASNHAHEKNTPEYGKRSIAVRSQKESASIKKIHRMTNERQPDSNPNPLDTTAEFITPSLKQPRSIVGAPRKSSTELMDLLMSDSSSLDLSMLVKESIFGNSDFRASKSNLIQGVPPATDYLASARETSPQSAKLVVGSKQKIQALKSPKPAVSPTRASLKKEYAATHQQTLTRQYRTRLKSESDSARASQELSVIQQPFLQIIIPTQKISRADWYRLKATTRDKTDVNFQNLPDSEDEFDGWLDHSEKQSNLSGFTKKRGYKRRKPRQNKSYVKQEYPKTKEEAGSWFFKKQQSNEEEVMGEPDEYTPQYLRKRRQTSYDLRRKKAVPRSSNLRTSRNGFESSSSKRSRLSKRQISYKRISTLIGASQTKVKLEPTAPRPQFQFDAHDSPEGLPATLEAQQALLGRLYYCGCGKVFGTQAGLSRHCKIKHNGVLPSNSHSPMKLRQQMGSSSSHLQRVTPRKHFDQRTADKHLDMAYHILTQGVSRSGHKDPEAKMREQLRSMSANLPFLYSMGTLENDFVHFEEGHRVFEQSLEAFLTKFHLSADRDPPTAPFPETVGDKMLVASQLAAVFQGPVRDWAQVVMALLDLDRRFIFLGATSTLRKVYYTNYNTPLSLTYVLAAFLLCIRDRVSSKYYAELTVCLSLLRIFVNKEHQLYLRDQLEDGSVNKGDEFCDLNNGETLPRFVPDFVTHGFPKLVLDAQRIRSPSALTILGVDPIQQVRVLHSLRLLCLWMHELGFTRTVLDIRHSAGPDLSKLREAAALADNCAASVSAVSRTPTVQRYQTRGSRTPPKPRIKKEPVQ